MTMFTSQWLRAALLVTAAVVATGMTTAAIIEQMVRKNVIQRYPVPGRLVAIEGGRRIQIDCRGSGTPTVVLESGLDMYGSLSWASVQDSIARTTRVCSYSRAGIQWSDPAPGPFSPERVARDLYAALTASGERMPLVLVGHSIGGSYALTFTKLFDANVSGIVLVDGSHPDQFSHVLAATGKQLAPSATEALLGAALAWTGLLRLLQPTAPANWPQDVGVVTQAFLPTSLDALALEIHAASSTLAIAGGCRTLGARPLIVLTAGAPPSPADLQTLGLDA